MNKVYLKLVPGDLIFGEKVFEGVQRHVLNMLRKCTFGVD